MNPNASAVSYRLCVRDYDSTGLNPKVALSISSSNLCLTISPTLPDVSYYVVGKPDLNTTNWTSLSFTLRATTTNLTWCTTFPTPYMFFQVRQGLSPKDQLPPIQFVLTYSGGEFVLCWNAPATLQFIVEYSDTLLPGSWTAFSTVVTSTTGTFKFTDDGSEFGFAPFRFYRVRLAP